MRLCAAATAAAVRGPASQQPASGRARRGAGRRSRRDRRDRQERVAAAARPHDAAIFDAHLLFLEDEGAGGGAHGGFRRRLSASQAWADAVATAAARGRPPRTRTSGSGGCARSATRYWRSSSNRGRARPSQAVRMVRGRPRTEPTGVAGADAPVAETADQAPRSRRVPCARPQPCAGGRDRHRAGGRHRVQRRDRPPTRPSWRERSASPVGSRRAGRGVADSAPAGWRATRTVTVERTRVPRRGTQLTPRSRRAALAAARAVAAEPAVTRDGVTVPVENIGSVREAQDAAALPAPMVSVCCARSSCSWSRRPPRRRGPGEGLRRRRGRPRRPPADPRAPGRGADSRCPPSEPEDNPFRGLRLGLAHPGMPLHGAAPARRRPRSAAGHVPHGRASPSCAARGPGARGTRVGRARGVAVPDRLETGIMLEVPGGSP